jgi:hypothetical protein
MKRLYASTIMALAAGLVLAATAPSDAASRKRVGQAAPQGQETIFIGRAYGNWFFSDGSQQRLGRTVAGAAPNILATGDGVRCEFRYMMRNGQRFKYEFCE